MIQKRGKRKIMRKVKKERFDIGMKKKRKANHETKKRERKARKIEQDLIIQLKTGERV